MNHNKAKAYDDKHGKDAYYYRHTKSGRGQAKAYDNYFGLSKKPKSAALMAKVDAPKSKGIKR